MNDSLVLGFVKVLVMAVLAFAVSLSFCQGLRMEDKSEALRQDVGQLRNDVQRLASQVREGGVAIAGPEKGSAVASAGDKDPAPAWVTGRARELWGKYPTTSPPIPSRSRFPP